MEVFDDEKSINRGRATEASQQKFDKPSEGGGKRDRYSLQVPEFPGKAVLGTKRTFGNLDPNEFPGSGLML